MVDILQKLKDSKKDLFVGIAGPGTGKSHTFKTIIDSDEYKGKKILILSFINKLVDDLSKDFKDHKNVTVSTLHSFARKQLGDVDLDPVLDALTSEDHFFIQGREIDFEEKLQTNTIQNSEVEFYRKRSDFYKHKKNLYSMNSIIYEVNRIFEKHPDKIPMMFDLILIDEFQDFNKLECEFITYLNNRSRMILVGDDNQSLYSFKKAEPEQIRKLYNESHTEEFSLDSCYRCTEVIVNAANDLISKAKKAGYLKDALDKEFIYPKGEVPAKDELSNEFSKIDFIPSVKGEQLLYKLKWHIEKNIKEGDKKRILIIVPSYLKHTIHDGLIRKGFVVAEHGLFVDEKRNEMKHRDIAEVFQTLDQRKTDNLSLRKVLHFYLSEDEISALIKKCEEKNKKIWTLLPEETRSKIENDIGLIKKVRTGKAHMSDVELQRFGEIFTLKNILSKMVKGFAPIAKEAIEVEMTTVMSSKGLSADFVYYLGIDDTNILDRDTRQFTDHCICEFLVGITRAKEKLTLISFTDPNPRILDFIAKSRINRINT